jgi:hypothetical protein
MTDPNTYDVNYKKLVRWLTPNRLRKSKMLAWLELLVSPVVAVYQNFLAFRKQKIYELGLSPLVPDLERMLRDKYDFTLRRIFIGDAQDKPTTYIYNRLENKPLFVRKRSEAQPKYLYTRGESGLLQDDFIVWVPMDIIFDFLEMGTLVKKYALPGMRFKIQRF